MRLDFAWQGALTQHQRSDIEDVANAAVRADHQVTASYMTLPEARAFGALALFGETYGEQVRVVEIGGPWSRELCGGTHVRGSAQIGPLALTGESSVGSGVRRVEAVVGLDGFRYLARERDLVRQLGELLKTPTDGLVERVSGMLARLRDVDKELAELRAQQATAAAGTLAQQATDIGGVAVVTGAPEGLGGGDLRTLALDVRGRLAADRPAVVLLASEAGGKVALVAALNAGAVERGLSAGELIKTAAPHAGGGGGGQPPGAQGGGAGERRRAGRRQARRRAGRRHRSRGDPRGAQGRRRGGRGRRRKVGDSCRSTTRRTPARSASASAACRRCRPHGPARRRPQGPAGSSTSPRRRSTCHAASRRSPTRPPRSTCRRGCRPGCPCRRGRTAAAAAGCWASTWARSASASRSPTPPARSPARWRR